MLLEPLQMLVFSSQYEPSGYVFVKTVAFSRGCTFSHVCGTILPMVCSHRPYSNDR